MYSKHLHRLITPIRSDINTSTDNCVQGVAKISPGIRPVTVVVRLENTPCSYKTTREKNIGISNLGRGKTESGHQNRGKLQFI